VRRRLVVGNWKLHTTRSCAESLAGAVVDVVTRENPPLEIALAPPFTFLAIVARVIEGSPVGLAAQDVFWEDEGAYTGEISAPMLADVGCKYCIVGHSERRRHFGETDHQVARKVSACLRHQLIPIVCVGESLAEREKGRAEDVVRRQVKAALVAVEEGQVVPVIAYEPVWAIGTGRAASPEDAARMSRVIREAVDELLGSNAGQRVRVLYGGSVNPGNVRGFAAEPDIDGALVGGASLRPDTFIPLVRAFAPGGSRR